MVGTGESDIQGIGLGVEIEHLPWAGSGGWNFGGHAAAKPEADADHKCQLGQRFDQGIHADLKMNAGLEQYEKFSAKVSAPIIQSLTQGIQREEEGESKSQAAKDQNILLPRG